MTRIISALFVLASCAGGQSFEVASIRLHTTPVRSIGINISGPRFTTEAVSLDNLITYAYDLQDYQVAGVPSWAVSSTNSDRYDIAAKAEGDGTLSRDQSKKLLQSLLAERFQLKFHYETKEMPVYALVVAKNGPKFKESPPEAQSMLRMGGNNGIEMNVTKGDMAQLARQFSNRNGVNRLVLDKTGLTGHYDYKLTWTLERGALDNDSQTVDIALQEQLGLKLEATKAPIEVLVVDHAEKPSGN
jgi:bla regulator protein blaR1